MLRHIFALRAEGLGPRRVGIHPRTGRPWTASGVQKVLATATRRLSV